MKNVKPSSIKIHKNLLEKDWTMDVSSRIHNLDLVNMEEVGFLI